MTVAAPLLTRRAVLQVAMESTYRTEATVGANDALYVEEPDYAVDVNLLERNFARDDISPLANIVGRRTAKVKHIGWTKLNVIAAILTNENVDDWVKVAQDSNTLTLIETVSTHVKKDKQVALEDQTKAKNVTTRSFKVHEDQKATIDTALAKAKEQSGTTVDTAALEFICLDYLGGQSLPQKLKSIGIEAALDALEKAFPNANIEVEITEDAA